MKLKPHCWEWYSDGQGIKSVLIVEDVFGNRGIAYDVPYMDTYESVELQAFNNPEPLTSQLALNLLIAHMNGEADIAGKLA